MLSDMNIEEALEADENYDGIGSTPSEWADRKHLPLGAVLMRAERPFRMLGIRDPKQQQLGRGAFGRAFKIDVHGQPTVLKLTRDPFEFAASSALVGRVTKHIVPIYGVWAVQCSFAVRHWVPWYVVHRGLLTPFEKRDAKLIDAIYDLRHDENVDLKRMPHERGDRLMRAKWEGWLRDELKELNITGPGVVARAMELLLEISAGVREMHTIGIDWADCHSKNVMRDERGRLRISDVGWNTPHEDNDAEVTWFTPEAVGDHLAKLKAS